ncbi:MAG: DUF423 domain-containing protein [Thermoanaerobaculales bacterium]|jgi:uncharacterized membrane protein YgdD (TMEM256/DUF423 family)|nr:DUF423 domain-containing protein [Thermoanaerobaculales bacterium]
MPAAGASGAERDARLVAAVGAVLGGLAVALGAFGAHALRVRLGADLLAAFETGVRYQMFHALALLALAPAIARWPQRRLTAAAWLVLAGTTVFSGSLVLLAVTGLRWLGAVTPVGGIVLIAGWSVAAWRLLAREPADRG